MLNLKNVPTTDVEQPATPTRTMKRLNPAAVMLGIALAAGCDGLMPPATPPTTATARATRPPVSEAVAPLEQATSIRVRTKTIRVGDSADEIFKTLEPADSGKTDVALDPTHPGSLVVTHHYQIEGQTFSLTFARDYDAGPYRLVRITTSSPQATRRTLFGALRPFMDFYEVSTATRCVDASLADFFELSTPSAQKQQASTGCWCPKLAVVARYIRESPSPLRLAGSSRVPALTRTRG